MSKAGPVPEIWLTAGACQENTEGPTDASNNRGSGQHPSKMRAIYRTLSADPNCLTLIENGFDPFDPFNDPFQNGLRVKAKKLKQKALKPL